MKAAPQLLAAAAADAVVPEDVIEMEFDSGLGEWAPEEVAATIRDEDLEEWVREQEMAAALRGEGWGIDETTSVQK